MREIINRISQEIISHSERLAGTPVLSGDISCTTYPFSLDNFKNLRLDSSIKELAFIDGGSSEIITSSSFSIYLVRVSSVIYVENLKEKVISKDFFILTKAEYEDKMSYVSKIFPCGDDAQFMIKFDPSDKTLKEGVNQAELSKIGGIVRRFIELKFAEETLSKLTENSMIVLDGSLKCNYTGEQEFMDKLISSAKSKNILLTAISKTNSLLTDTGASVEQVLKKMSFDLTEDFKMWFYHPLIKMGSDDYPADILMARLHKRSKHIFKVEICNKFDLINYNKIFGCLALNSADPVFLGYPYGLIKADENARVDSEMTEYIRIHFLKSVDAENLESSKNAHQILDKIRF